MSLLTTAKNGTSAAEEQGNQLFPIFLKLNQLQVLLVGAGNVGLEKLTALLSNSPEVKVRIVAEQVSNEVQQLAAGYPGVVISQRSFEAADLGNTDLALVATNNSELNQHIRQLASQRNLLVNFADKPALCDFYLGSVAKKGNLKIAISTNGKSPTVAKRLKEIIEEGVPDEINDTLDNMSTLRDTLKGNFTDKVHRLNEVTAILVEKS